MGGRFIFSLEVIFRYGNFDNSASIFYFIGLAVILGEIIM